MAKVELVNVTKVFNREVVAASDVSFVVEDSEFVVILGPSGCGKTTILRLIAGLETLTKGEIRIDNKVVNNIPPKDRNIAMVFQNYALYPHMSVFDNMAFGLKMRGFKKPIIKKRVEGTSQILGIDKLLERKPRELSGGQRQRVALGRAIVRHPDVFLFDEPLSNLDAKMRVKMRAELSKLHKRLNATSIYVTHDQVEAMTLGDKIVLLNEGKVQQIADPMNLYHAPANRFVAGFIGSPPMNFIDGKLEEEGRELFFVEGEMKFKVLDDKRQKLSIYGKRAVTLGIRPENIRHVSKNTEGETTLAVVDLVETLGNEILLYVSVNNNSLVARVPPGENLKEGEKIILSFDLEKVHFFDVKTGINITL